MKNCLVLSHVKQPYYDFHLKEFETFFNKVDNFMYMKFFHQFGLRNMENEILKIISTNQITHIILWQWHSNYIPRLEFLNELRQKVFIILWLFDDDIYMHSHGKFYAQVSDVIVTTDWYGKLFYEQLNINSVYYMGTYSKNIYKPLHSQKTIDVSFVGAMHKADRQEYVNFLLQNNINVQCFGKGSNNEYISEEQMIEIFNKSKINLNFTKIGFEESIYESTPLVARIRQNKGRPLEIGLTNSFCLTEDAPSLKYLFDTKNEIDTFNNKYKLLHKVKYYLENYEEAEKKANLMYQKCLSQYEKENYFPIVFNKIFSFGKDKNSIQYYSIEKNMNFKIREKAFYFKSFFYFFKKKRYKISLEILKYFFQHTRLLLILYSINEAYKIYKKGVSK